MVPIRVLVVEDSLTVRKYLVEVLERDPGFEVVGEAIHGERAVELCKSLRPDVVSMDMMMPVMTGLAATEQIMAYCPTPILIVSASVNRAEVFNTYDALAAGALDAVEKPSGLEADEAWERRYLGALRVASRVKVIRHLKGRFAPGAPAVGTPAPAAPPPSAPPPGPSRAVRLVAIGGSTGAPAAIVEILRGLPADYPLPVLLVLHIGAPFAFSFVEWLGSLSPLPVAYARDGEPLPEAGQGRVIMAPPDEHLVVRGGRLVLTRDPERHSCRPSVDVLFESIARELRAASAAYLLTGMGRDGAAGLRDIRRAGGLTFAQDEATSVVYGMPREAVQIGGAAGVLPLDRIAQSLIDLGQAAREVAT